MDLFNTKKNALGRPVTFHPVVTKDEVLQLAVQVNRFIAKCDSETKQSWSSSDHYDEIMSLKEDLNNLREVNWNIYEALEQVYDMENFLDDFHDASSEEAKQSKYQMAQRIGEFYERLTLATENNVNVVQLLKELTEASKAWSHRENIEW